MKSQTPGRAAGEASTLVEGDAEDEEQVGEVGGLLRELDAGDDEVREAGGEDEEGPDEGEHHARPRARRVG